MNIYDLERLATPGPYAFGASWVGPAGLPMRTGSPHMTSGTSAFPHDGRLLAHCRNNFMRALEALKEEHERVQDWLGEHGSSCGGIELCSTCKLIAELEEVK